MDLINWCTWKTISKSSTWLSKTWCTIRKSQTSYCYSTDINSTQMLSQNTGQKHAAGMTEEKEWDPRSSFKTKCKWNPCVIQRNLPGRN